MRDQKKENARGKYWLDPAQQCLREDVFAKETSVDQGQVQMSVVEVVIRVNISTLSLFSRFKFIDQEYKSVFPVERLNRDYMPSGLQSRYIFLKPGLAGI